jgi:hypothetical protein
MTPDTLKESNHIFYGILFYYSITYIFFFWRIDSFAKDLIIAPLFFMVPTGFGLLLFSIFKMHKKLLKFLTATQVALTASFLGFVFITLLYMQLNVMQSLPSVFPFLYPALNLLSLHGFYNTREILQINDTFKSSLKTIAILSPLFFITYYFHFVHFSPFPLRDIFQDVHFMKGALELSKHYIINIATGDSYIPLLQVNWGVLNYFYNYNLINSQWILPIYAFFFNYLCLKCFYSSIIKDRFILTFALGFAIIFPVQIFAVQNHYFMISFALLLFSILVNKNKDCTKAMPVALELIWLSVLFLMLYFSRKIPSASETFFPYLFYYFIFMLSISFFNLNKLLPVAFVILMLFISPTIHRSAAMLIPLILVLYVIYFLNFQWLTINNDRIKYSFFKKLIKYGIICISLGILVGFLIAENWPSANTFVKSFSDPIYFLMGGDGDYYPIGFIGIMSEWFRIASPVVYVLFLLLSITIFVKVKAGHITGLIESDISYINFYFISILFLSVVFFAPIPHMHRVIPFITVIFFLCMAYMLKKIYQDIYLNGDTRAAKIIIPIVILTYTLIAKYIYDMPWKYEYTGKPPYLSELFPIPEIGVVIILLSLFFLMRTHKKKSYIAWSMVVVIIISGAAIDRFKMVTKLYENSYGNDFPEPKVISHYSIVEFNAAKHLGSLIDRSGSKLWVMISDPYTLGIFEAVTGTNGFYTFSNLGVMKKEYKEKLKVIFRNIFPPLKDFSTKSTINIDKNKIKNTLLLLTDFYEKNIGAMPEAQYFLYSRFGQQLNADFFNKQLVWIVNEKTIKWAYEDVGYYPQNNKIPNAYIKDYILPYFNVILNYDNRIFALTLKPSIESTAIMY